MTRRVTAEPDMSYESFNELLALIQSKGIKATFPIPLVVGDAPGLIDMSLGEPVVISFINPKGDMTITNLHISFNSRENTVELTRWKWPEDFCHYNRELTDEEMDILYNAGEGLSYPFEEEK